MDSTTKGQLMDASTTRSFPPARAVALVLIARFPELLNAG